METSVQKMDKNLLFSAHDILRIIDNVRDGVYCIDPARRIVYWNTAAERITGYKAEEVLGRSCCDNILTHIDERGTSLCKGMCPLAACMKSRKTGEANIYLHHRNGHRIPIRVRTIPLLNDRQEVIGGIEIFTQSDATDVLHRKIFDLEKLSLVDALTQLPNRRHLQSEITGALTHLVTIGVPFGVVFFDVDDFKQFNDTYGHDAGDTLLRTLAQTLTSCARPYDVIGRWGGEEFVGVFPNTERPLLCEIAERLRILILQSRIHTGDEILSVTASIGGTPAEASDTLDSLVQRADALMYESKRNGKNRVTIR